MNRVALVTGGTRGIGAAISQALKSAGCRVAANYGANDEAARRFREATGVAVYKWDVSDFAACEAGAAQIEADLGPIDILVNNAGITRDGTLQKMTPERWQAVLDTNLGSCFNLCHATFPGMRTRKFGRVVNVGSINGQAGQYGQVNYAAAKSGIHGFTKALAQEGARHGITVNAVAPGYVDTDMVRAVPESGAGEDRGFHSGGPARPGGRHRSCRPLPHRRRRRFHHRVHDLCQRRPPYVLMLERTG